MSNDFLPPDYKPPTNEGKYLKFKEPETRFRFLDSPIRGWLGWKDKKPVRKPNLGDFTEKDVDGGDLSKVRHFWAAPVWGYALKRVQVLEITQATIQRTIWNLARDPDWGSPLGYDIVVTSSAPGSKETEYTVLPRPQRPAGVTVDDAWAEARMQGFDIARLWTGGDPFNDAASSPNEPVPYDERNPPADDDGTIPF